MTDALGNKYKEKGNRLDKIMEPRKSSSYGKNGRGSSNVHEPFPSGKRASEPMTRSDILRQYRIGKPSKCTLWYRCPKTWTPDMVKFYTKIQKSKRNFDWRKVLNKIRDKHGSTPMDWTLDPMDIYKTGPSSVKCYECKQYGHTAYDCQQPYKPIVCIMCGLEGHHFDTCRKKICLSCGSWQSKLINNCHACVLMRKTICKICNTVGHGPNYCTESWRQFHNITSTEPEPECNEFTQNTSRSNAEETCQSTPRKSETSSAFLTTIDQRRNKISPKTDDFCKSKKIKRL